MAVRLQFLPRQEPPDFLALPWATPLSDWDHPRLVQMARGDSRHVVRFVAAEERVYALKETSLADAEHEYAMLRQLAIENLPVVAAAGLVTGRQTPAGDPLDAVLVTRYLDFALPYRYLFTMEGGPGLVRKLVDAAVVLLARLHVDGFYWGDCSLSNLLFRRDAGALKAYLVDAETTEHHDTLSPGLRQADLELAIENVGGGLFDLEAAGKLAADIDIIGVTELLGERYGALWDELTGPLVIGVDERYLIEQRIRSLNELGFDVEELVVDHDAPGHRLHVCPALVEEGHHARALRRLTGLDVQENQARRLLGDIAAFGAYLSRIDGRQVGDAIVAARWIAEVYEPILAGIPDDLRGRLEPPEVFHELLEHRYYLSSQAGHEIDNPTALRSYLETVLRHRPQEKTLATEE